MRISLHLLLDNKRKMSLSDQKPHTRIPKQINLSKINQLIWIIIVLRIGVGDYFLCWNKLPKRNPLLFNSFSISNKNQSITVWIKINLYPIWISKRVTRMTIMILFFLLKELPLGDLSHEEDNNKNRHRNRYKRFSQSPQPFLEEGWCLRSIKRT